MRFRQIIREYFSFSKGERVGLMILIIVMIVILIADRLIFYFEKPAVADRERFEKLITGLEQQQADKPMPGSLFIFDPNTIDSVRLDSLALPFRIKQNLLKYRSRGGHFNTKEDLRRIYGMNDSVYAVIERFIEIKKRRPGSVMTFPHAEVRSEHHEAKYIEPDTANVVVKVEINHATKEDLIKLYGIGPVLSERIIKYRNLLGGFYSLKQLEEVYGLTTETLTGIAGQLEIDSTALVSININFAGAGELAKHPYLEWKDANRIIHYREKTGFIEDSYQLLRDSVLSNEIFEKVGPYLQTISD
jgi:competence ComEA-like helix-hairpin-helix protein